MNTYALDLKKYEALARRAAQTALYKILDAITLLMTPILAFTADEIWRYMPHDSSKDKRSPLFNDIPQPDYIGADKAFMEKWELIHKVRVDVQKALELARNEKKIGKSLEAHIVLGASGSLYDFLSEMQQALPEIFITSGVSVTNEAQPFAGDVEGLSVGVEPARGEKCERCWKYSETVGSDKEHPELCARCAAVLGEQ